MQASTFFKATPFITEKINKLCRLLMQEKEEFEAVATTIKDRDLRCTVLTLAQNNNQYATELSSQMQSMCGEENEGGIPIHAFYYDHPDETLLKKFSDENEIMAFCNLNEKKMISAYRDILNESVLYEDLRKMIRYQLNGILYAFMQLRLLSSLKLS